MIKQLLEGTPEVNPTGHRFNVNQPPPQIFKIFCSFSPLTSEVHAFRHYQSVYSPHSSVQSAPNHGVLPSSFPLVGAC